MYEEDWGFFVYLEEDKKCKISEEVEEPFQIQNQTQNQTQNQIQKQNKYQKTLILNNELNLYYLPIIYEEYEWYTNDNTESEYQIKIDIDSSTSQENIVDVDDIEKKKSCLYNKKSMLIYYAVCISFISLAFII